MMKRSVLISIVLAMVISILAVGVYSESFSNNSVRTNYVNSQLFDNLNFTNEEILGATLPNKQLVNSVVVPTELTGENNLLISTTSGEPGYFNVYDLDTNVRISSFPTVDKNGNEVGAVSWSHTVDSKGNVYMTTYKGAKLYKYTPKITAKNQSESFRLVSTMMCSEEGTTHNEPTGLACTVDDNDNVYIGTNNHAKLYKYNPITDTTTDLGVVFKGAATKDEQYTKSLEYYNGYLYMGNYSATPKFVRYNVSAGAITDENRSRIVENITIPTSFQAEMGVSRVIDSLYSMRQVGKYTFIYCEAHFENSAGTKRNIMLVYDCDAKRFVSINNKITNVTYNYIDGATGLYPTDDNNNKVYITTINGLVELNLTTFIGTLSINNQTASIRKGGFVTLRNSSYFGNSRVFANVLADGTIVVFDPLVSAKRKSYYDKLRFTYSIVRGFDINNNKLYTGAYMGSSVAQIDLSKIDLNYNHEFYGAFTEESLNFIEGIGQPEGMTHSGNKTYFGVYPDARIFELDNSKPIDTANKNLNLRNPKQIIELDTMLKQDRPFAFEVHDNYLIIGCITDYGLHQGALAFMDLTTNQWTAVDNQNVYTASFIPNAVPEKLPTVNWNKVLTGNKLPVNQCVTGVAYKNGIIYGSTGIWGGIGAAPLADVSEIFSYNISTKEVKTQKLIFGTYQSDFVGEIEVGPDGNIWGISSGVVFACDPVTLSPIKYKNIAGFARYTKERFQPYRVFFDENNIMYASPRDIPVAINIDTLEVKDIIPSNAAITNPDGSWTYLGKKKIAEMIPGNDGYIYYVTTTDKAIVTRVKKPTLKIDTPQVPTEPVITQDNKVEIPFEPIAEAVGYKIVVTDESGTNTEHNIEYVNNKVDLSKILNKVGNYKIKIVALSDGSKDESEPSKEISISREAVVLGKPTVADKQFMNEEQKGQFDLYNKETGAIPTNVSNEELSKFVPNKILVKLDVMYNDSYYLLVDVNYNLPQM